METVTLIIPLEATTVNNPSDRTSENGVTARVTVEQHQESCSTVTPAVTPLLLLMSLGLFTVVASRGRIRVTVAIGDCQAHMSSFL